MYNVLFDLGNVLIDFDHTVISQRLVQHFPVNQRSVTLQDELHRFIFGSGDKFSWNVDLDRGTKDIDALRNDLGEQFDINIPQSDFQEIWSSIFTDQVNADALACLNQLRESGLNVAICSNTNPAHWNPLLEKHAELRELSKEITCFLSYEMGKQKADPGFFDAIAGATKSAAEHHVLIDDLAENCRSAESAGMHSVLFKPKDPGESIGRINKFVKTHSWV